MRVGPWWRLSIRKIDTFELWCWRRLLTVPWTARRSNQSILKKIHPEYSLEGLMLKLKLQCFGHLNRRLTHWKRPWAGKNWGQEEKGGQRTRWLVATWTECTWVSKLKVIVMDREAWRAAVHVVTKSGRGLSDWKTTTVPSCVSLNGQNYMFNTVILLRLELK